MISKVLSTCQEMFEARGYKIESINRNAIFGFTDKDKSVYLVILEDSKFNIDVIKYYYGYVVKNSIQHLIIVYEDLMTPSVKKIINKMGIPVEIFKYKELIYNITKHYLVPKHERVERDGRDISNYPIIKRNDPVCRFYNFQTGDLIRIHRKNGTIYYRVVK